MALVFDCMNGNQKPGLMNLQILKTNMQGNVGESIRRISILTLAVLTMTVFNTGMTDLEKRKRYLMDLLAEKLKSSKISNSFLCKQQNYYSFFLNKTHSSSFFPTFIVSGRL